MSKLRSLIILITLFSFNLICDNINLMDNGYFIGSYPTNCAGGLYGIGADYQEKIKAYIFQWECPLFNDDSNNPLPEEKRELQANDIIYRDEECLAIVLEKFPCYCSDMGKEEWIFEFEEGDGNTFFSEIIHDPSLPYPYNGWIVFGLAWKYGQPLPCFLADLWHGISFYEKRYINCISNEQKFGFWKLRFKYCSSVEGCTILKEWNLEFRNVDRGRIKLTLPDNPESILPDGLEIEPSTASGGDTTRLNVYFENCDGPVERQSISFRQQFINGTGGHNHSEPPECGSTSTHPTCGSVNPQIVTTDRKGNAVATYNAPIYSGGSYIKTLTNYNGYERESKEKKIKIKVPNLIPFSSLISINVPDNNPCIHGDQNLYVTSDMEEQLGYLISYWFWNESNPSPKIYPRMTAGSLPWGGKFDDGECWSSNESRNHRWHRRGKDMDIGKLNFTDTNKRNVFNNLANSLYIKQQIFIEIDHQDDFHWHFRLRR